MKAVKVMVRLVYHGTTLEFADNIVKNGIDLTIGRKNLDFGQGFYTTADKRQAIEWAKKVSYNVRPAVIVFQSSLDNLNVKYFPFQNDEWKDVVYKNRILKVDPLTGYDCVIGPINSTFNFGRKFKQNYKESDCRLIIVAPNCHLSSGGTPPYPPLRGGLDLRKY